jgi:hypothetical protein
VTNADQRPIREGPIRDYEIQGGCVTVTKQGLKDAAEEKGPFGQSKGSDLTLPVAADSPDCGGRDHLGTVGGIISERWAASSQSSPGGAGKSRPRGGRPRTPDEIRQLIREMSVANPLWGAPRIHGELLKLGM